MKIPAITPILYSNDPFQTKEKRIAIQPTAKDTFSYIAFQAIDVRALKKMPLEKKLASLFTTITTSDLVVVGKNLKEVQAGLMKTLTSYDNFIKRLLFVKHGGITVPLAFAPNDEDDEIACINIGEKPILLSSVDDTNTIEPNDSCTLADGDVIINNKMNIPIETMADFGEYLDDADDMDIVTRPESYATQVLDFTEVQQKWIQKANAEAISTIQKTEQVEKKEEKSKKISFKDVGGLDKVIDVLKKSIVYPIKFPFAYKNVNVNRGILLHGKPGTGKTLVAEALANESNAHFIKISGTELETKWVGETEEKWRNLFSEAREKQPSIIFIDELDAVVKNRTGSANSQHEEKVVTQILSLMSDLEKGDDNVFVIATTNKPDTIDPAVLRSGRFGKQIEVIPPDRKGRDAILTIQTRGKQLDPGLDREKLLDEFDKRNYTGADIKHIANEAHTNSWIRTAVYEKMDNDTLTPEDMEEVSITLEDFMLAIADLDAQKVEKKCEPIGFKTSKR